MHTTLLLILVAPFHWQETPLTADEAVRQAVKNSPRLTAAMRDTLAAEHRLRSARSLVNPEIVVAPEFTEGGSDEGLLIRQPLEINGTRAARTAVASARRRSAEALALHELGSLVFDVKSAYYVLVRARAEVSLATDLLANAREFDRITQRQVELGSRPGIDRVQTQIEVERARQQLAHTQAAETSARAALNALLARPTDAAIGELDAPAASIEEIGRDAAIRQALERRQDLAAATADVDALRQEGRLAKAEGLPDIAPQYRMESWTRGGGGSGFGVSVSIPMIDYGARRWAIRETEEAARAQADRVEALRHRIRAEVEQAVARHRAAEQTLVLYQEGVLAQARRLLDASRIGLEEGKTSVIAVLEAQRTYRAVQTEYVNALNEHATALADLQRATGAVSPDLLEVARRNR